jgi:hypothetical protein
MMLSTDIWVAALIRRAELAGGFGIVARKGDARAGSVLVKVLNLDDKTTRLYSEATRGDGERIWMRPSLFDSEADLDRYIQRVPAHRPRSLGVDIEDKQGRHFLTEPVEDG